LLKRGRGMGMVLDERKESDTECAGSCSGL
jgi:hypothetical protein